MVVYNMAYIGIYIIDACIIEEWYMIYINVKVIGIHSSWDRTVGSRLGSNIPFLAIYEWNCIIYGKIYVKGKMVSDGYYNQMRKIGKCNYYEYMEINIRYGHWYHSNMGRHGFLIVIIGCMRFIVCSNQSIVRRQGEIKWDMDENRILIYHRKVS